MRDNYRRRVIINCTGERVSSLNFGYHPLNRVTWQSCKRDI